ncbi:Flp family type IVb pilin [Erysipelotrichaceae bacterium OH741_COT-311]|nr:Flp family type IVb pilin [Erysipelotrichaceae bacterium OH741_COT-311]
MTKLLNWFTQEESGQGLVEYGLILALIAIVVIAAMSAVGGKLQGLFNKIENTLPA